MGRDWVRDSVLITVEQGEDFGVDISSITFPNILTANNDGKNDSWYPYLADMPDVEALGVLTNYALRIYNRWDRWSSPTQAMGLPPAPPSGGTAMATAATTFPRARTTTWSTSPRRVGTARTALPAGTSSSSGNEKGRPEGRPFLMDSAHAISRRTLHRR